MDEIERLHRELEAERLRRLQLEQAFAPLKLLIDNAPKSARWVNIQTVRRAVEAAELS